LESYYLDPRELVCLNCPIIDGCDETNKDCLYQKHPNSRRNILRRHYKKKNLNARKKPSDEQLRLNRIEYQKQYQKRYRKKMKAKKEEMCLHIG